jgi:uncharacterized membrane protein YfcA
MGVIAVLLGLLAGWIDSIAGGGGLITLPTLSLMLEPGVHAIGSNKIVGTVAALVALLIYARGGHLRVKHGFVYVLSVAAGSFAGSRVAPFLPSEAFRWLMIGVCPVILWVIWKKDFLIPAHLALEEKTNWEKRAGAKLWAAGLLAGFYDGAFGPGGGTFMFLALILVARAPLFPSMALSKLANVASALTSGVSYALAGYVHWRAGALVALGAGVGAFFGARMANKHAARIVRPVLAFVVTLLLVRLAISR